MTTSTNSAPRYREGESLSSIVTGMITFVAIATIIVIAMYVLKLLPSAVSESDTSVDFSDMGFTIAETTN